MIVTGTAEENQVVFDAGAEWTEPTSPVNKNIRNLKSEGLLAVVVSVDRSDRTHHDSDSTQDHHQSPQIIQEPAGQIYQVGIKHTLHLF